MKSSELIDLFKQGNIVIPLFFLQHYSDFGIEMKEFVFLMYLYHLGNQSLFNPDQFSRDLNMDISEIMQLIETLSDKRLIRVEVVKNEKGIMEEIISLDDFYQKVSFLVMNKLNHADNLDTSTIFEVIEKEFGRTLSPIEYEIIRAWLDNGMSEELIREAVKEATFNNVSNLRYIDKILYEWGKAGIKSAKDVEESRKKRMKQKEEDTSLDVDLDMVDWNWFDDDE